MKSLYNVKETLYRLFIFSNSYHVLVDTGTEFESYTLALIIKMVNDEFISDSGVFCQ